MGDNTFRYGSGGGARSGVQAPARAERHASGRWVRWIRPDDDTIGATVGWRNGEPETGQGSVWTLGLAPGVYGPGSEQAGAKTQTAGLRGSRPASSPASGMQPAPAAARKAVPKEHGGSSNGGVRSGTRVVPAATYWRRRFVVLTALLLVLATAGWSLSKAFNIHRGANGAAASASGDRRATGRGLAGSQSPQAGTVSRPNSSATPSLSVGWSGGVSQVPCPTQSIVLSLSTGRANSGLANSGQSNGQSTYGPAQLPDFRVSVVSTQPADCTFNLGAGQLGVLIKKGTARIWNSADCIRGSRRLVTVLKRGVPTSRSIGWGRNTSAPGCSGPMRFVGPGTYAAYAVDGSLVSAPVTLRLS